MMWTVVIETLVDKEKWIWRFNTVKTDLEDAAMKVYDYYASLVVTEPNAGDIISVSLQNEDNVIKARSYDEANG